MTPGFMNRKDRLKAMPPAPPVITAGSEAIILELARLIARQMAREAFLASLREHDSR